MIKQSVGYLGLGCYIPEKVITNKDLENLVQAFLNAESPSSVKRARVTSARIIIKVMLFGVGTVVSGEEPFGFNPRTRGLLLLTSFLSTLASDHFIKCKDKSLIVLDQRN